MAALSCQDRPAAADADSIECATILFLSVAIMIVTTPARALWQVMFEHAIDDFD